MVRSHVTDTGQKHGHGNFSYSLTISHILVKLKHRFKYYRNVALSSNKASVPAKCYVLNIKKKSFLFLKKACGHEDESVGLSGYCM